ncbi:Pyridoxal phosphate phosphatase PHOSPHO2 [Cyphellophora attinorum]|uniref:Pyridoxal phosphate phosphatase PHOSPHO2 n=1 Tax=Cyphellophora attinorum TaxID=1664694 RepID=A0A0N1HFT9_9EURO|nr:Pyridoxal phosphate phosphatase PHOSPHO2 [Phialophora attinorum]KPI44282.1 Pyridoxal phosphate phosphatase PHOSPHO2 [Phialophora attinorum]
MTYHQQPSPTSHTSQILLLIFDFDHTLINVNSDLLPFQSPETLPYGTQLSAQIPKLIERLGPKSWTRMMRLGLAALSRREGYERAELEACMRAVRMDEELVKALQVLGARSRLSDRRSAAGLGDRDEESEQGENEVTTRQDSKSSGAPVVEMVIASDANNVFIETILNANGLSSPTIFQNIYTNRAKWVSEPNLTEEDEGILRSFDLELQQSDDQSVRTTAKQGVPTAIDLADKPILDVQPYQSPSNPHDCTRCAPNMCKSTILIQSKLDLGLNGASSQQLRTVYVGDGFNDYCPALSLDTGDLLLVREGYALEKLLKREQEEDKEAATEKDAAVSDAEVTEEGENRQGAEVMKTGAAQDHKSMKPKVKAEIKYWKTQADLAVLLLQLTGAKGTARQSDVNIENVEITGPRQMPGEANSPGDLVQHFSKKAVL